MLVYEGQLRAGRWPVFVNSRKQGVSFVTDEGVRYILQQSVSASWIKTADSVYRATIYYNKVQEQTAEVVRLMSMPTLIPRDASLYKRQPQDPLGIESCWVTPNGNTHALSLVCDEVHLNDDHTRTAYYRLLHEQREAPEYYTNRRYVSILLPDKNRPDSVQLTIQTYDGLVVRKFKI